MNRLVIALALALGTAALGIVSPAAAQSVPTPAEYFGFVPGASRELADWNDLTGFYEELARGSERVVLDTLGMTTRGRPMVMLTVTSAANQARLDELRTIQMKLADPRTIESPAELERLLSQGRTIVLLTHQIHSTEVGGGQMAANLLHRLATSDSERVQAILENVVLLDIPSLNPDGLQWVADWYRRFRGTEYEAAPLPWLYQFYVGHDNNRDWYAFTQQETQLAIQFAHNAWHPHIVHDIHQMGGNGARIFFPPYIEPWDPRIDPALTSAVNQLGSYMAADLTGRGMPGVVINAQYDAYTPARAYQHYHAGARILSETASARLASPRTVDPSVFGPGRGFDSSQRSWNFPNPWEGGEWGLPDIVRYMDAGAMALLDNAARNRRYWLENFHGIGARAVDGPEDGPVGWIIPASPRNVDENPAGLSYLLRVMTMAEVEVRQTTTRVEWDGETFPAGSWVIDLRQPYASFAQTLMETQEYPDLREYPGGPPLRPYDVTAHTLPLLFNVDAVPLERLEYDPSASVTWPADVWDLSFPLPMPELDFSTPAELAGPDAPRVAVYKGWRESMESGWTRWVLDQHEIQYDTLHDARVRAGSLKNDYDVILFQDQSPERIVQGFEPGTLPAEYTGGIGSRGLASLRQFVNAGGRVVAVEEAADLMIELFNLNVFNPVERLPPEDFYIPGSILEIEVDEEHPITSQLEPVQAAWFWRSSRAFQISDPTVQVLARYGPFPVLSGWALGADLLSGQPAAVEVEVGRGSVVLFGFQPNYRAQTVSTWPFLFRALSADVN